MSAYADHARAAQEALTEANRAEMQHQYENCMTKAKINALLAIAAAIAATPVVGPPASTIPETVKEQP